MLDSEKANEYLTSEPVRGALMTSGTKPGPPSLSPASDPVSPFVDAIAAAAATAAVTPIVLFPDCVRAFVTGSMAGLLKLPAVDLLPRLARLARLWRCFRAWWFVTSPRGRLSFRTTTMRFASVEFFTTSKSLGLVQFRSVMLGFKLPRPTDCIITMYAALDEHDAGTTVTCAKALAFVAVMRAYSLSSFSCLIRSSESRSSPGLARIVLATTASRGRTPAPVSCVVRCTILTWSSRRFGLSGSSTRQSTCGSQCSGSSGTSAVSSRTARRIFSVDA
mmetsp:Transcript_7/g.23  ORF Transcript_7/g.23 Transcript_7/m.23 type:complete len:277 (+) Transcript_7:1686-2516(+)